MTCSVDSSFSTILVLVDDLPWTATTVFSAADISVFYSDAILTVQMFIIERGVVSTFFDQTCSSDLCMGPAESEMGFYFDVG
jgi:sulfur relay (sulfurtransferase) DsrF/TusC family protein